MTITGQISPKDTKIEYSTNGTDWTDMSGYSNKTAGTGGAREVVGTPVFDADVPVMTAGKRKELDLAVDCIYASGSAAGNPYRTFEAAYQNGSALYVRYAPQGLSTSGSAGSDLFTSSAGIVSEPPYITDLDGASANAVAFSGRVKFASLTRSTL